MTIRPQPARKPRPPIMIAAHVDAAVERAARVADGWCIVPTPRLEVVAALMDQHRTGITHVTMRTSWPGMKQDDVLAGIELLGKKVLPEVRRRIAAAATN